MGIAIGKYKERITILAPAYLKDGYGQDVVSYATAYTLWARYMPLGGSEPFEAKEKTARRYAEFHIRFQGITIDETYLVQWNGYTFDIVSIDQTEYRTVYKLRCLSKDNVSV